MYRNMFFNIFFLKEFYVNQMDFIRIDNIPYGFQVLSRWQGLDFVNENTGFRSVFIIML